MKTINLISHPGSRGVHGFGPVEFPFLDEREYTKVASIRASEFIEHDGRLYVGGSASTYLDDFEGTLAPEENVYFDGDVMAHFRSGDKLVFTSEGVYVPRYEPDIPVFDQTDLRVTWLQSAGPGWVSYVSSLFEQRSRNLRDPRCRKVYTILEAASIPEAGVAIHNEQAARRYFDQVAALDQKILDMTSHLDRQLVKARAELDRIEQSTKLGFPLPERFTVERSGRSEISFFNAAPIPVHSDLLVLRWIRELFNHPVGEMFGEER